MSTSRLVLLMLLLNIFTVAGGVGVSYWLLKPESAGLFEAVAASADAPDPVKYDYHPVTKIIVGLRGEAREHYFVLDLVLQAEASKENDFAGAEPLVRNSVVSYLSTLKFEELRSLQISEVQGRLETALFADFASKNAAVPFQHVLVSKLIVQ